MRVKIGSFPQYSVDENGVVINEITGEIKSKYINKKTGYITVDLWKDGKVCKKTLHRLLAEIFIPNPENKPTVDHKDGNRTNNSLSNLRWATYSEQNSRFDTIGIRSEKILVTRYSADNLELEKMYFDRIKDAAEYFGVTISNISLMLKKGTIGKRGKMRYYRFEYCKNRN